MAIFKKNKQIKNDKPITQSGIVTETFSQDVEIALGHCGLKDKHELSEVMSRITDQMHLEIIAKKSSMDQARMWAAGKLNDKSIANSVYGAMRYSSDVLIRMAAQQEYKEIKEANTAETDQPAWMSDNLEEARAAVEKLTDQSLLIDIVKSKNYCIETQAEKRLLEILSDQTEQPVLADIAKNFSFLPLRKKAVEMLTDQTSLAEIAKKNYYLGGKICEAAVKKLTDKTVLDEIMNGTESEYTRVYTEVCTRENNGAVVYGFNSIRIDLRKTARERIAELEQNK